MPAKGETMAIGEHARPAGVAEVPRNLVEGPPPRTLGFADQAALSGNLGISLLLFVALAAASAERARRPRPPRRASRRAERPAAPSVPPRRASRCEGGTRGRDAEQVH